MRLASPLPHSDTSRRQRRSSGGRTGLGAYPSSTDPGFTRAAKDAARQPDPEEDPMPTSRKTRGLIVILAGAVAACGAQSADDQFAEQPPADEQLAEQPVEEPMSILTAEIERSEEHTSELQSRENIVCRL